MNIFSGRLPQPRSSTTSGAQFFLRMTEEEYRTWLKERGFSDHYIEQELRQLREVRDRLGLPGPAKPEAEETAGGGPFDRAAERRRERKDNKEKHK